MRFNYSTLFLVFFIYSILGYIVESICVSLVKKEVVYNRGFLIGPYLPIFGFGGLIMVVMLDKYSNDIVALFIMSMASCMVLEYLSSFILEKLFKLRWWDYSEKKFNLNGRICLETGIMFGVAGIFVIKFINPFILKLFKMISSRALLITAIVLTIIILIDFAISAKTVIKFRTNFTRYTKDSTAEVKAKVLEELSKNSFFIKRLLKAFPNARDKFNEYRKLREQFYKKLKFKQKNMK